MVTTEETTIIEVPEQKTEVITANPGEINRVYEEPRQITPLDIVNNAMMQGKEINLEQIEKLYELQERLENKEAKKAYNKAMAEFKRNAPTIVKNKSVNFTSKRTGVKTNYNHATLDEVINKCMPKLSQSGLSISWDIKKQNNQIFVTCICTHELGHSNSVTRSGPPDTSGSKNALQAESSTITVLERYTALAILGLATEGQDDDGHAAGQQSFTSANQPKQELTPNHLSWGYAMQSYKRTGDFNEIESKMIISDANKKALKDAANAMA